MGNRQPYQVIVIGLVFLFVCLTSTTVGLAAADTRHDPSPDPESFWGVYTKPGFILQPESRYMYVGQSSVLTTAATTSYGAIPFRESYQWLRSVDNRKTWQPLNKASDDATAKSDLMVMPTKEGTMYYQMHYRYFLSVFGLAPYDYYSQVAAVTALPDPVPTKALQVSADETYLYNDQKDHVMTMYVHGKLSPATATGEIKWSSSDETLATVDVSTGLVTANAQEKSGIVTITGTIENLDGSQVTADVPLTIGGGLDDVDVAEGQAAHFAVLGKLTPPPSQVKWHRIDATGKDTVVASNSSTTYTIPAVTMADNNVKYQAEIVVKLPNEAGPLTFKTRQAQLNVRPDTRSKVVLTSELKNQSGQDDVGNTLTKLSNVVAGDVCQITGTLTETNAYSTLATGTLTLKLPPKSGQIGVTIDNRPVAYTYERQSGVVTVAGIDFTKKRKHQYQVTFTSQSTTPQTVTTAPQLTTYNTTNQPLTPASGPTLTFHVTDGQLHATAYNANFGTLSFKDVGHDVPGQVVGGDTLLEVHDYRRKKTATRVNLQQVTPFRQGSRELAATLSLRGGQTPLPLVVGKEQTVAQVAAGHVVSSIGSATGHHLTVRLAMAAIYAGTYTTTLNWTFATAP